MRSPQLPRSLPLPRVVLFCFACLWLGCRRASCRGPCHLSTLLGAKGTRCQQRLPVLHSGERPFSFDFPVCGYAVTRTCAFNASASMLSVS